MSADQLQPTLRRSLIATLAYFDLFEYPLTLAELLRFRYRLPGEAVTGGWTAADALEALDDPAFGQKDGYFFLAGRAANVETRLRRFRESSRKLARARRVNAALRVLPSVKLVAVCNSLALHNADVDSDIDLFVVCAEGTLWSTRLLVVGALAMLGLRPTETTHANRVCMSFFVSEAAMDLSRFALQPDDTYMRYWLATLLHLHDESGTQRRFVASNAWAHDRLPGLSARDSVKATATPAWSKPLLVALRKLDPVARKIQMAKFPAAIRQAANTDTHVVISDEVLKFHIGDRRAEYEQRFAAKLRELGIESLAAAPSEAAAEEKELTRA